MKQEINETKLRIREDGKVKKLFNSMFFGNLSLLNLCCYIVFVFLLFSAVMFPVSSGEPDKSKKILILNSNSSVKKYYVMQNEFKTKSNYQNVELDLGSGSKWKDDKWIKNTIRDEKPDLLFCIGSKAYIQASNLANKIPKIFSMGINWERMNITNNTFVVASEVPATTQLMMYRYFFPEITVLGVLYNKSNNKQWFRNAVSEADDMGIKLTGKAIKRNTELKEALQDMLPNVDAIWLIPDPVIMSGKDDVVLIFKQCNDYGKPVFAYKKIFGDYGAAFIVSADVRTMARQVVQIAADSLEGNETDIKVENPAGSYISINLKKIEMYGVKLNSKAIHSVNYFIK